MSNAKPHTMMSFTPIDSDLNNPFGLDCNNEKSLTGMLPIVKHFALQSFETKNIFQALDGVRPRIGLPAGSSFVSLAASRITCSSVERYSR